MVQKIPPPITEPISAVRSLHGFRGPHPPPYSSPPRVLHRLLPRTLRPPISFPPFRRSPGPRFTILRGDSRRSYTLLVPAFPDSLFRRFSLVGAGGVHVRTPLHPRLGVVAMWVKDADRDSVPNASDGWDLSTETSGPSIARTELASKPGEGASPNRSSSHRFPMVGFRTGRRVPGLSAVG
ncbi:hypothetical protein GW17_00042622 [Ensete ventricosum]|nr:hypothetical protein GW17_00042622 [Ensete ventricosum]RZR88631.1 hypothetical protein BHM03_00016253 [Ensete ventricosum]